MISISLNAGGFHGAVGLGLIVSNPLNYSRLMVFMASARGNRAPLPLPPLSRRLLALNSTHGSVSKLTTVVCIFRVTTQTVTDLDPP